MLTLLGVPHKTASAFWIKNETQLEYIYNDFIRESKKLKCRLHPDHGGDPELFVRFNKLCVMVANAFLIRGVGPQSSIKAMQSNEDGYIKKLAKASLRYKLLKSARH